MSNMFTNIIRSTKIFEKPKKQKKQKSINDANISLFHLYRQPTFHPKS